ncbi:hypothetical protein ACTFIW_009673 [Dictyostelium discoideum]
MLTDGKRNINSNHNVLKNVILEQVFFSPIGTSEYCGALSVCSYSVPLYDPTKFTQSSLGVLGFNIYYTKLIIIYNNNNNSNDSSNSTNGPFGLYSPYSPCKKCYTAYMAYEFLHGL